MLDSKRPTNYGAATLSDGIDIEPLDTGLLPQRVKARLVDAILDGAFTDGLLPSETELARMFGVSRPTVRGALRSLEEEGLITRRRGIGTRINPHVARSRITLNRVVGFWDLIQEAGHEPGLAYTRMRRAPASLETAARFGCEPEEPLLLIERLFTADAEPAIAITEMIRRAHLRNDVQAEDVSESIFQFADDNATEPIDHTVVEITPVVADPELCELLSVPAGDPLLRLIETHYSRQATLLMVSDIHVVDRFVRFNVIRRRV